MADSDSNPEQSTKNFNSNEMNGGNNNISQALLNLMNQTGYEIMQENGQRKYGGPPPGWQGPAPLKGSEVFVGKIPRDCFEDELVPIFNNIGKIYEMRLMMDFSGSNRGYAFVMYTSAEDAKKAIQQLNNYQIRQGKYIGVVKSVDNCRLFVGGIPKTKTKEEIRDEMSKVTEGVVDVILYNSPKDKAKNRGFAFIEYESHRAAAIARRKLIPGRIQLWGQTIMVDWAEPEPEVDEDIMARVKVLYVRNLMESTSEETIREKFEAKNPGSVEKVKKLRDFAFVHFTNREHAEEALMDLNESDLDGSQIEVTWAKPPDRSSGRNFNRGSPQANSMSPYSYNASYGMHDLQQINYNAVATPAMVNAPMGGRGSYGMRSPIRGRGRGAAGLRGGRGFYGGGGSRHPEYRFYDFHPGLHILPTSQVPIRQTKLPVQALADFCQKHNFGEPVYTLVSGMVRQQGPSNASEQLFAYKVVIPNWGTHNPAPNQFCRGVEEAKQLAAQCTMMEMEAWDDLSSDHPSSPQTPPLSSPAPLSSFSDVGSPSHSPYSQVYLTKDFSPSMAPVGLSCVNVAPGLGGRYKSCDMPSPFYGYPPNAYSMSAATTHY